MIDEMILSMMSWIASTTGQPVPAPPAVALRSVSVRPSLSPLAPHLLAVHESDTATVHLARDWDESDPVDQSVLLHALLHHVQSRSPCTCRFHNARESDAYRLQALWLGQQGIDFRLAFGMSPSLISRLRLCARDAAAIR